MGHLILWTNTSLQQARMECVCVCVCEPEDSNAVAQGAPFPPGEAHASSIRRATEHTYWIALAFLKVCK
jgi:hypothetical protein